MAYMYACTIYRDRGTSKGAQVTHAWPPQRRQEPRRRVTGAPLRSPCRRRRHRHRHRGFAPRRAGRVAPSATFRQVERRRRRRRPQRVASKRDHTGGDGSSRPRRAARRCTTTRLHIAGRSAVVAASRRLTTEESSPGRCTLCVTSCREIKEYERRRRFSIPSSRSSIALASFIISSRSAIPCQTFVNLQSVINGHYDSNMKYLN